MKIIHKLKEQIQFEKACAAMDVVYQVHPLLRTDITENHSHIFVALSEYDMGELVNQPGKNAASRAFIR